MPSAPKPSEHPVHSSLASFLASHRPFLVILAGPARTLEIELDQARFRIGRGPGVDLSLDDPELGRAHAELRFAGAGFELVDLGSDGGTRINGALTTQDTLKDGDRLQMGRQLLEFVIEAREQLSGIAADDDGAGLERDLAALAR